MSSSIFIIARYPNGGWLISDGAYYDEDSTRLYRTYLLANVNTTLDILVGIDDGHSIYVDDLFIDGDGFGIESQASINLLAGIPVKLEVLGYNGAGPSNVAVIRADNREPIETTPGLRIHADGVFVPEPSTIALVFAILGMLAIGKASRGRES